MVGPYGRAVAGLLLRPDIESPRWARFASPNPLQTRIAPTGGFLRFPVLRNSLLSHESREL